jgi:hypothetical protein
MRRPITRKVQNLHGKYASRCGRYECESTEHYPGISLRLPDVTIRIFSSRDKEMVIEKSAEVIVVPPLAHMRQPNFLI